MAGLSMDSSASGAAAFEVLSRLASQDLGFGQLPAVPVGVSSSSLGGGGGGGLGASLGVLDSAFRAAQPQPVDSDWARSRPRHPVATPPTFPRAPPDIMSAPGLFRRMDPEALFFAFYYQPDTYQQYLAAQELKRQSWRYHKHHNAWFQRYAEPSVTNDEYEQVRGGDAGRCAQVYACFGSGGEQRIGASGRGVATGCSWRPTALIGTGC
jgi:CCR4-NOT transcription complex subunit 3